MPDPDTQRSSGKEPLAAVWPCDGEETVVWQGRAALTGQQQPRETELLVAWEPTLEVRYRQPELTGLEAFQWAADTDNNMRLRIPELEVK